MDVIRNNLNTTTANGNVEVVELRVANKMGNHPNFYFYRYGSVFEAAFRRYTSLIVFASHIPGIDMQREEVEQLNAARGS